ncbi:MULTISPECIES: chemotaxis protein CheA [unclassified Colwellia]|uniref:chemotaxis protein CheA n=1 Tax=unclassified Colwellia TaxID=196834 RepID=UPI0015F58BC3|nr:MULTISPECIES: chemotaxis protein CheA [unclassified Colwellia]MBA6234112.1 chemotaxis protein CheA [Colwellia sp. MB02u-7]MBA6237966.1 chemotaxis protein CheA [Colwellia sp. MB02u-11]MBA6257721.1 chemotaxis protein CheA [Colwellia sp. MB3u-28]MBA6259478.1 chemotaxis protein CheA [Colwellia sp. MB3u-41]MBA6300786.1 chemotaxis protein CheA [Colwellia sp. MB3u-22]
MSVDLSQFIPSFLEESFEGLELMESSLLNLEQGDDETINSIFRAAHSIKGGAGTFGFNHVTEFTHLVETLLDEMRDGRRNIDPDDVELLLESVDCMRLLIEAIRDESECNSEKIAENSRLLRQTLASSGSVISEVVTINVDELATENNNDMTTWQIKFIPEHHLVQTGNDPLLLFNALADLGEITVVANAKELPALNDIDAEELYLSWCLTLRSNASEDDIKEVFEWVEDECELILIKEENVKLSKISVDVSSAEGVSDESTLSELCVSSSKIATNTPEPSQKNNVDKPAGKSKNDLGSIRVGVDKVDSLINLVGELVITQSMLSELGNDFDLSKVERLNAGLEQLLQNTKELQESVMRIRMLPISFAFNRFPRLVHDLSKKTGKEIELILKGEQTELDKTVMEQIGDPLVHLVRNAVDHGIESAQVRLANGKPEKGTIILDAYHQGGSIVIEISDDGGGIDRQAVFNKALEKGLVDESTTLTDSQVFDLIFEPGFSTAKELSDISGRGVGMDVVKQNIQSLGGRIQVESEQGKGSTFRVNLPLTLAILDGQLVRVGREVYIIPLITIVESLQPQKTLINRVSGDMLLYRLREDNVPVIPIYQLFNIPCEFEHIERCLLVVVEADGQKIGLMVDDLLAQQQVVIKSLNDNYQQVEGVSGATILGDGSVAMILDVPGIITMALSKAQSNQQNQSHVTPSISAGVIS